MNLNGYTTFTTFWQDFTIAESFGKEAIRDTFKRAFAEWRHDYKYLTELVMVLNHKCWYFYQNPQRNADVYCKLYGDLYYEAADYAMETLKGEELDYYWRITD